jgi:hypothetical protein
MTRHLRPSCTSYRKACSSAACSLSVFLQVRQGEGFWGMLWFAARVCLPTDVDISGDLTHASTSHKSRCTCHAHNCLQHIQQVVADLRMAAAAAADAWQLGSAMCGCYACSPPLTTQHSVAHLSVCRYGRTKASRACWGLLGLVEPDRPQKAMSQGLRRSCAARLTGRGLASIPFAVAYWAGAPQHQRGHTMCRL